MRASLYQQCLIIFKVKHHGKSPLHNRRHSCNRLGDWICRLPRRRPYSYIAGDRIDCSDNACYQRAQSRLITDAQASHLQIGYPYNRQAIPKVGWLFFCPNFKQPARCRIVSSFRRLASTHRAPPGTGYPPPGTSGMTIN